MTTPRPPDTGDRRGVVVELCGLPGSGKTTVASALAARLREAGVGCSVVDRTVSAAVPPQRRLPRKVAMVTRAVGSDPVGEARTALMLGARQLRPRDMVAIPVQWWVAKQLVGRARSAQGTAIAEEGLVQALWTAGLVSTAAEVPELVGLAESTARPDLVVHLDTPFELTLERLRSRGSRHSRVQALGDAEQRAARTRGDTLLRSLLAEWTRRGYGEVVSVDATDPVDRIAAMLTRSADGTPAEHSDQGDR